MTKPKHPDHPQINQTIAGWFHQPFDEMGYRVEVRQWGAYWNIATIYTFGFPPAEVEPFLADARKYYADQSQDIVIRIDNRQAATELGPRLVKAGCQLHETEVFLAHTGPPPVRPQRTDIHIEPVTEANLATFAAVRIKSFANTEDDPDPVRLKNLIERRRNELTGTGRGWLARLKGQPAGVLGGFAEERDLWISDLGTRLPFRRQGVGKVLLSHIINEAYDQQFRSVIINVLTNNQPALALYHRLGFRDEVYWRQSYILAR